MIWIKRQLDNPAVTDFYLQTIAEAFSQCGQTVQVFSTWNEYLPQKDDLTIIATPLEVIEMVKRRQRFAMWFQGIRPEESFSVHHSWLRSKILEITELIVLKKGEFFFFVSTYMREHFEKKYHMDLSQKSFIMACSNESMHKENFFVSNKYEKNVFCYAGSINTWQCVDEMLALYKQIEDHIPGTELLLLVKDKVLAEKMLKEHDIHHYEIDFVPVDALQYRLKDVKYGFILRDDIELNRVATPTKMSTYIVNGVIPIISDCLYGLMEIAGQSRFVVHLKNKTDIDAILESIQSSIIAEAVYQDFLEMYKTHYDRDRKSKEIARFLR